MVFDLEVRFRLGFRFRDTVGGGAAELVETFSEGEGLGSGTVF